MAQWILKKNGEIVPRRTCRRLRIDEIHSEVEKTKQAEFDKNILKIHGNSMSIPVSDPKPKPEDWSLDDFIEADEGDIPVRQLPDDPVDASGKAVFEQPFYDAIIHAEVMLPQGEKMKSARVEG